MPFTSASAALIPLERSVANTFSSCTAARAGSPFAVCGTLPASAGAARAKSAAETRFRIGRRAFMWRGFVRTWPRIVDEEKAELMRHIGRLRWHGKTPPARRRARAAVRFDRRRRGAAADALLRGQVRAHAAADRRAVLHPRFAAARLARRAGQQGRAAVSRGTGPLAAVQAGGERPARLLALRRGGRLRQQGLTLSRAY